MPVYRTQALILRSRNYGETDRLLTLLTRERGKIGAIAKGARKPTSRLRGGIQPLTQCQLLLHDGRNLHTVTQAEPIEAFAGLHGNVERFAHASYMAELIDKLTPDGSGSDLFPLLLTFWHLLDAYPANLVTRLFELRLLAQIGYCPELHQCIDCGKTIELQVSGAIPPVYSSQMGGIVCEGCRHRHTDVIPVAPNTLALLRHMLTTDPRQVGRIKVGDRILQQVTHILQESIRCRYEGNLRSWAVIEAVCNGPK